MVHKLLSNQNHTGIRKGCHDYLDIESHESVLVSKPRQMYQLSWGNYALVTCLHLRCIA